MKCETCGKSNINSFKFCGYCGTQFTVLAEPKKIIKMYLHGNKEDNASKGEELGLSEEAIKNFTYALYEVEFDVEVDMKTGDTKIVACDGNKLIGGSK